MLSRPPNANVRWIKCCALHVGDGIWRYARSNAAAIDRHWDAARLNNPGYFNGVIHLIDEMTVADAGLSARLLRTDFKSYLYWRDHGFEEAGVLDGFGSALIRSADGDIILGQQRPGNINAGLSYLPGGFIDARDAAPNGTIDLAASVWRELAEETGLGQGDLVAGDGFYLTCDGAQVSLALPVTARLSTRDLKDKIDQHLAADPDPELAGVVAVRDFSDIHGLAMAPYARVLVSYLLGDARRT
jgi:NUDIX domain